MDNDFNNFIKNVKPKMFKITKKELVSQYPEIFYYKGKAFNYTDEDKAKEILKDYYIPNMIADGKLSGKPAVTEYVNKNGNVVKYESYYGKKSIRKPNKYDSLNTPEIIDMIKTINDNTIIIAHIRDLLTPQENINYSYNDLYQFCARKKRLLFL